MLSCVLYRRILIGKILCDVNIVEAINFSESYWVRRLLIGLLKINSSPF